MRGTCGPGDRLLCSPLRACRIEALRSVLGNRYYFLPMLAFFACLIWLVSRSTAKFPRYAALAILLLSPIGVLRDWKYKPYADFDFPRYAAMFERAAPGTRVIIPTNPTSTLWTMELDKR